MSAGAVFITGTDTGVGKTRVAQALLRAHVAAGRRAVGMKPVAAGIEPGEEVNADVAALARAGNVDAPLADRNPYAFAPAVAPHLAAAATGVAIDLAAIAAAYARLAARADVVIVEGAGGALVPLDARHDMLDVALCLRLPVLLVVGLRVGCLNHAFLSERAIRARGLVLAGWVANAIGPGMVLQDENVAALSRRLAAPCIAVVEHGAFAQLPSPWLPGVEPC
ncbi:MAG: dethiobiotin synthase [Casimicrobiaceae bacterium]